MDKPQANQPNPDSTPGVDLNQSVRSRAGYGPRLLSPWVRNWLQPDTSTPEVRQPAFLRPQQPVMLTQAGTSFVLHRIQRMPERSVSWKPDVGSLKPGMTDPLTRKVASRSQFKPVGVKPKTESAPEQMGPNYRQEPEFALPGQGTVASSTTDFEQEIRQKGSLLDAIRQQGGEVSDKVPEILKNLPRSGGQLIPPAPRKRKKTVRERPKISPKSRLFTAIQEVDVGRGETQPEEQPPAQPAPEPTDAASSEDAASSFDDVAQKTASGSAPPKEPPAALQLNIEPEPDLESKPPPDTETPLPPVKPQPPNLVQRAKKSDKPIIKPDQPAVPETKSSRPVIKPDQPVQNSAPMPDEQKLSPRLIPKTPPLESESVRSAETPEIKTEPSPDFPPVKPIQSKLSTEPTTVISEPETEALSLPVIKPDRLPTERAAEMTPPALPDFWRKPEKPVQSAPKTAAVTSSESDETPAAPETPPVEPERPLLRLDKTIQKQREEKPPLPLVKPRRPSQTTPRIIKPTPSPVITPQVARTQLAVRGWRFKTRPSDSSSDSKRIIQTASSLENPGGSGAPLADEPRTAMEGTLGRDFSDVRVHRADLGPLNVQAATRGRDVFFDKGQDDFDRPEGMALLGHELTHVGHSGVTQAKPVETSPIMRMPTAVESDEAEADQVEQAVYRQAQTGSLPLARPVIQRAEIPDTEPEAGTFLSDVGMDDHYDQVQGQQETFQENQLELKTDWFDSQQTDDETTFTELQDTLEEMIDERMAEMMGALGLDETEEATPQPGLDDLARQILPFLKRLIVVERERRAV